MPDVGQADRKWVVAAYQRIRKERRAYSLDELMAALPPPPGRTPGELAEMLDKVLALRRLKKSPARWDLGGEVRMRQPDAHTRLISPEVKDLTAEPTALPVQNTPRPKFTLGPWRAGASAGHLNSGSFEGSWSELLRALTDALSDGYVDRLSLAIHEPSSEPLRIFAVRGLDPIPFFLAYSRVDSAQRSLNLAALNWHLWRPESALSYDTPELALRAPTDRLAVATWRTDSPFNLARSVCHSLHLLTGATRPAADVTVTLAGSTRRQELVSIERARQLYSRERRADAKPVRGYCRACGHALRDAASLRRGYGPDCWERISDHRRVGIENAPDLPAHYWAGALPISGLRRRIQEDLARRD